METVREQTGKTKKAKGVDYSALAIQAGATIVQGALWGLASTFASRLAAPKVQMPDLTGATDVIPIRGKAGNA